jgi:hypothetical protein
MSAEEWSKRVLRRWLKRLLQPVTSRAYVRIDNRIAELKRQVSELNTLRGDIDRTVTTVLKALSNQNASSRLQARELEAQRAGLAEEITRQVEIARKEILEEVTHARSAEAREGVETNALDP